MNERPPWFDKLFDAELHNKLMVFAMRLSLKHEKTEDLVSEAKLKALANWDKFQQETNFEAWMCTILRNTFYDDCRKENRVDYGDDAVENAINMSHTKPNQLHVIALSELEERMNQLPEILQEAIRPRRIEGLSYEEAAEKAGVPYRTMQSRLKSAVKNLGEKEDFI